MEKVDDNIEDLVNRTDRERDVCNSSQCARKFLSRTSRHGACPSCEYLFGSRRYWWLWDALAIRRGLPRAIGAAGRNLRPWRQSADLLRSSSRPASWEVEPRCATRASNDLTWPGLCDLTRERYHRGSRAGALVESAGQQPAGGDAPVMAAAPAALTGLVGAGLATSIEMLSLHAAVFGVGTTLGVGLMLVLVVSESTVGG